MNVGEDGNYRFYKVEIPKPKLTVTRLSSADSKDIYTNENNEQDIFYPKSLYFLIGYKIVADTDKTDETNETYDTEGGGKKTRKNRKHKKKSNTKKKKCM